MRNGGSEYCYEGVFIDISLGHHYAPKAQSTIGHSRTTATADEAKWARIKYTEPDNK